MPESCTHTQWTVIKSVKGYRLRQWNTNNRENNFFATLVLGSQRRYTNERLSSLSGLVLFVTKSSTRQEQESRASIDDDNNKVLIDLHLSLLQREEQKGMLNQRRDGNCLWISFWGSLFVSFVLHDTASNSMKQMTTNQAIIFKNALTSDTQTAVMHDKHQTKEKKNHRVMQDTLSYRIHYSLHA